MWCQGAGLRADAAGDLRVTSLCVRRAESGVRSQEGGVRGRSQRVAAASVALWFGESGRAEGEARRFEPDRRSAAAAAAAAATVWVTRRRRLPRRPRLHRGGGRAGGVRQEEAELGGLGGQQGSAVGSSPFTSLLLHLPLSFPIIHFSSLGRGAGDVRAGEGSVSGGFRFWRRSLGWGSVRQWFLVFLIGGVKYL